ncbi:hypothetical protein [Polaromonas jejuensis]|uniref:XRE family transcriptional regulator n=1 Tax=Polaromonas jejuensis TaxID=457502 RepID=A0ABW0QD65_9BURK|nr:hypothetical protein [Polaromonas jejuensis]
MQWISEGDLKRWSERLDARALLIDMVGDLIRATVADASQFRFPGGDSAQIRGFDGDLETTEAISVVPGQKSKWEFGVSPGRGKADGDYEKRTGKTDPAIMRENTLVIVNLCRWDVPKTTLVDWVAEKKGESKWLDVKYIDGVALVQWLEEHPAVAATYARRVLETAPRHDALSTDEFWERYSTGFKPTLSGQVLLCDRDEQRQQLLQALGGRPQNIMLGAESAEEVIAFAVAAIRSAPEDQRRLLEARTLIVESEQAAQFLTGRKNLVFLAWKSAENLTGMLGQRGPTLAAATGVQRRQHANLARPTASAMAEAMVSMGIPREDGYELALRCGRSLTVLRRLRPSGIAQPAQWAQHANNLKPALLAGGWTVNSKLDTDVLAALAGHGDYDAVEALIRPTMTLSDPPLDRVNEVWQVRAPVDAFPFYGHLVDSKDLQRLREAAIKVFSHAVPRPTRDERFSLEYKPPADYSSWLRDGIALTLLMFAAMPEVGGLHFNETTPQQYVDSIVRELPGFAKGHKWLEPILDQASLLAEAAPNPFLEALESMLEGDGEAAKHLFAAQGEDDFMFGPTSPHTYILWALEVLAWHPAYLQRSALVLARLAEVDPTPSSRNGNRPLNSLRAIFISWSPNTHAKLSQRIAAIDAILRHVPSMGWDLLMQLLPRSHDTSSPTQKPKLRDASPVAAEEITFGLVWDTETEIVGRAMKMAQGNEERLIALVEALPNFQPASRSQVLELIDQYLQQHMDGHGNPLWHALREQASKHAYFEDSDWALKGEDLSAIREIIERHAPTDQVAKIRFLFDDWTPHIGERDGDEIAAVDRARADALFRLWESEGQAGILRLAETAKLPQSMGPAVQSLPLSLNDTESLMFAFWDAGGEQAQIAVMLSGAARTRLGDEWKARMRDLVVPRCVSNRQVAEFLAAWPRDRETWAYVEALGKDRHDAYWRYAGTLPWQSSTEDLLFAVQELRRVNRSLHVINMIHRRAKDIPSDVLMGLLDDALQELAAGDIAISNMLSYYLKDVFETLSGRDDVSRQDLARREYAYLPLIEREAKSLVLHEFMAEDPAFYVEVLTHVFASKDDPRDRIPTDQERARAKTSYKLLSSFHRLPGQQGSEIDAVVLRTWVDEVRRLASERGRAAIGDEYVGQLLAHAPTDTETGAWPPATVCTVIEGLVADGVERGLEVERINMRGVYSKAYQEGGGQERNLAHTYQGWANAAQKSPRVVAMLTRIAETWLRYAELADIEADKSMLKR